MQNYYISSFIDMSSCPIVYKQTRAIMKKNDKFNSYGYCLYFRKEKMGTGGRGYHQLNIWKGFSQTFKFSIRVLELRMTEKKLGCSFFHPHQGNTKRQMVDLLPFSTEIQFEGNHNQ